MQGQFHEEHTEKGGGERYAAGESGLWEIWVFFISFLYKEMVPLIKWSTIEWDKTAELTEYLVDGYDWVMIYGDVEVFIQWLFVLISSVHTYLMLSKAFSWICLPFKLFIESL